MRIIIIGILYVVYMLLRCPQWLASADTPYLVRAMTYSFFHANIFHLAVNCLAAWCMWRPRWDRENIREFFTALVIAFIIYPIGAHPCIGFSNVLFATAGLHIRNLLTAWSWRKGEIIFFYAMIVGMCFLPQFAGLSHLFAYIAGAMLAELKYSLSPLIRDVSRYIRDVSRYTGNR